LLASAILRLLGDRPIGFVDVGARGGVHPIVDPIGPAVAVLGFEPDPAESERLRGDRSLMQRYARLQIETAALADRIGPATLYEVSAPTNSSLRSPNSVFVERYGMTKWHTVGQVPIDTTTLDHVLFERRQSESEWGEAIKIDTQGTEYEILLGAARTLRERTMFVCVEVSFCELYVGQKLFSDVELLLRQHGFAFYGFDRTFNRSRKSLDKRNCWGRERPIQADAYFFKDPFDRNPDFVRPANRRIWTILAAFAFMTGYHDFALELLERLDEPTGELRRAVLAQSELPVETSRSDARELLRSIEAHPENANVLVGKFVDRRRSRNDYFDTPTDL
jgi:FkbM family methyltransferase